jgi:paraquat-inducible protein B
LNYGFNAGSIANKGIEIVLSGKVLKEINNGDTVNYRKALT